MIVVAHTSEVRHCKHGYRAGLYEVVINSITILSLSLLLLIWLLLFHSFAQWELFVYEADHVNIKSKCTTL